MSEVVSAPADWVASVGDLALPETADTRLQWLMDRNNDGLLSNAERSELESLATWSEEVSLLRARASRILGKPLSA